MCFIENLKRNKVLRDAEVGILEEWYDWCMENARIETNLIGIYILPAFCCFAPQVVCP